MFKITILMEWNIWYSLNFAWNSLISFLFEKPFLIIIILSIITWSIISRYLKKKLKEKYIMWYESETNIENKQFYIDYYKKTQLIDVIWFFIIFSLLFTYLLTKDKIIWTVLAVWIWAIVLTFQSFIVSFFTYFLLVWKYKIWDTVKIWSNGIQWEILYIKSLYTWISGKNDFGESTGEFFAIPNNQIRTNPITKMDLSLDSYTKVSISILYSQDKYKMTFEKFIETVKLYLSKLLPLRNASNVSHFKTYIWVRYKIDFDYDKDWNIIMRLWFITTRSKSVELKWKIISFVETIKSLDGI